MTHLTHVPGPARKIKKSPPLKKFLLFPEMKLTSSNIPGLYSYTDEIFSEQNKF